MDVGVQINQYKVVEHIGRGGMADVWSARDIRLNRMVAIKTIAHGLSQDVDPISMFKQEAQTIAQMEHPHILPIYDFGEFEGQLYIVMRYVAGGSLEDMLRRGPLPLDEALRMGRAVAEALDYAHSSKVVHLDLKPPNVLLDSHSSPYLADFGLATVLDLEGKATNPGSGTLLYMAPEQLTAETIDHRADIYSFGIVLFHMLTGQLPFQAAIPLALKQVQYNAELPDVDMVNPALPSFLNGILRRATSMTVEERPNSIKELMTEINEMLMASTGYMMAIPRQTAEFAGADFGDAALMAGKVPEGADAEMREAIDIYTRAHHAWAGGNGRFLLGMTHFLVMIGYYMNADHYGLELDESGMQMLLRGALEFDHEVDFWWNEMDDDNRRWVCLHTVRTGTAPARVRALYRLETLPDSDKPQIPKLVAQALQVETNEDARLAALQVLGTRSKLMKAMPQYDIKTEYRGRMLTTMTRLGIQVNPPSDWIEAVYSPEIDLLIAETALDNSMPRVAEFAARIIGRMRSTTAVRAIAVAQKEGRQGALRALALVRDEAPSLPPVVASGGRLYAWLANTWRRMTDIPLNIVWRYLFALFGAWLGMGFHVNQVYISGAIVSQARWASTIGMGLVFGVVAAFVPVFAEEFPSRLRRFWPVWGRTIISLVLGTAFGMLAWYSFLYLFLNQSPTYPVLIYGGLGLSLGFLLTSMLKLRSWVAILLTAFFIYAPIFITYEVGWAYKDIGPFTYGDKLPFQFDGALLYYVNITPEGVLFNPKELFTVAIPFALMIAIGGHFPLLVNDVTVLIRGVRRRLFKPAQEPVSEMMPQPIGFKAPIITANAVNMATELDPQGDLALYNTDVEVAAAEHEEREIAPPKPSIFDSNTAPVVVQHVSPTAETDNVKNFPMDGEISAQTQPKPKYNNISYGKGIKLDVPNMKTELDPSRRPKDESDEKLD